MPIDNEPGLAASTEEVIANMQARADKCRWLATQILESRTAETLRRMAQDIEADIRRLRTDYLDRRG